MEPKIKRIIDHYYQDQSVEVRDVRLLNESPDLGITCLRWRAGNVTVTIKAIEQQGSLIINTIS